MNFLVIPLFKRKITAQEIVQMQKNCKNRLQIVILCEKNHPILQGFSKQKAGVWVDAFPVGTTEDQMIATSIKSLPPNGIILVRDNCQYFSMQSVERLLEKAEDGADIAMFRGKKQSKLRNWFLKIYKKMCKFFFNFTFFEGNISLMYFSPRAHLVLTETNVVSMTKINRWVQMRIEYIDVDGLPPNQTTKMPVGLIAKFLAYAMWTLAMVGLLIFLPKWVTLNLVYAMLIFTGALLGLVLLAYTGMQIFCHKHIGAVHAKNIELWERREL